MGARMMFPPRPQGGVATTDGHTELRQLLGRPIVGVLGVAGGPAS